MKPYLVLLAFLAGCGRSNQPKHPSTAEELACRSFVRHILELTDHPTKNMAKAEFAAYQANPQAHVDKTCGNPKYLAFKRALGEKHVECMKAATTSRELDVCYEQLTTERLAAEDKAASAARKPCPAATFAGGTATIRGIVTASGEPSEMATVIAIESAFEGDTVEPNDSPLAMSDSRGKYVLDKLHPGYYTVRFYVGDQQVTKSCVAAHAAKPVALDQSL